MSSSNHKQHAKESERRQATVMFADIAGFTSIAEKMDPEEVTSLVNECFNIMAQVIDRHGGTIDKFIGDCIMSLFGVPTAIEDAPRRAVNAATEMRNCLYQYNQDKNLKIPLDIHIGINTGEVISGEVGADIKREYTVMGDAVNVASRLEDASEAGQILVGPVTYRYTKDAFDYRALSPLYLKGKKESIHVYELLSQRTSNRINGTTSQRMIFSTIVGRQRELDTLELQVFKVINGESSIVNVIGEAGIGKSRLLAELRSKEEIKRVILLEGRAMSIGKGLSFHPLISLLKDWAGIKEEDNEAESAFKLEKKIEEICQEQASEIFPFVATLMGMKLSGEQAKKIEAIESDTLAQLIINNLRELLTRMSELKPLVIIIEDLHWSDTSSIEILELLFKLVQQNRVMFINVFRPRYKDTGERLIKTIEERYSSYYVEIVLRALKEAESETLVRNLLKIRNLPQHIKHQITERSEGNPFFIEEIIRELIDNRIIEVSRGKFRITDRILSAIIPASINEVIMARIDRLEEETKDLLRVASVIGRSFFYKILMQVVQSAEKIDAKIEYLKSIQMIRERRRMSELEYLFKHALAQEAIYESILLKRRRELHLGVARSIESVFKEKLHELYGMLAYHYGRGEDLDNTEKYLIKAGEVASKSAASSEALFYYHKALELYLNKNENEIDKNKAANLEKNIGQAYYNKGQYTNAIHHFERALVYLGEKPRRKNVLYLIRCVSIAFTMLKLLLFGSLKQKRTASIKDNQIINLLYKNGQSLNLVNPERLFPEFLRIFQLLTRFDLNSVENGTMILGNFSVGLANFGLFGLARKIIDYVEEYVDKDHPQIGFDYKLNKLWASFFIGDWETEYEESLLKCNLDHVETLRVILYATFHGLIKIEKGNLKDIKPILMQLSDIAELYENDDAWVCYYELYSKYLLKIREPKQAIDKVGKGIAAAEKSNQLPMLIYFLGMKSKIEILLDKTELAGNTLLKANRLINEQSNLWSLYLIRYYLGQTWYNLKLLSDSSDTSENLAMYRKETYKSISKSVAHSRKVAVDRTETYRLMGLYYWYKHKQKKALKWFEKSMIQGEKLGARLELSRTYFEIGKRLSGKISRYKELNGFSVEDYFKKAEVLFQEMDLQWDLKELERVKNNR